MARVGTTTSTPLWTNGMDVHTWIYKWIYKWNFEAIH
ncbi:Uncharacterized protein HZ326_29044, partial [Fusarium oxysporum f. sp. albedinis]